MPAPSSAAQENLAVHVASGDAFDIREFSVHERISTLFQVTLIALCHNPQVDFEAAVGLPARFSMQIGHGGARVFQGICNELQQIAAEDTGLSTYRISIVPSLWLATQRRNYRMFQQLSELDIVLALLEEWSIKPVLKLDRAAYKKRKYRVQYAESDFAFMSRMLEDAGISFYFEPSDGESTLILSDSPQSNEPRELPIAFRDNPSVADREHVTAVRVGRRVRPGRYTLRDHDYRMAPSYKLVASASASRASAVEERLERYHFTPGAFLFGADKGDDTPHADDRGKTRTNEAEAAKLAQKRLEAKRGSATTITFATNAHDLAPGTVMSILDHPRPDLAPTKSLLLIESAIHGTSDGEWSHQCEARSAESPYRPEVATPRPKVSGVESATVVGPPGEEIHCDEFGRVRVHFHWDRESKMDDRSSCWIHVSQPWGGAGFGGTNLPRVGQEVLVDFLGGDPDRPVIIGRVFTNLQKVPYKLPDNKTQSGWKSSSTTGTGGYNEMMFEDSAGKELFRLQAERDMTKLVKNDENVTVGNNRTSAVHQNESVSVGVNRTSVVGNDETASVAQNRTRSVGGEEKVTVGKNRKKVVKGSEATTIQKNLTKSVRGNERETTKGNRSTAVGLNRSTRVAGDDMTAVGGTHTVTIAGEGGGATTAQMQDDKIVFSTAGGAMLTLEGNKVTIAAESIFLMAEQFLGGASAGETVIGGVSKLTLGSSGGDVIVRGGPMVKINTP